MNDIIRALVTQANSIKEITIYSDPRIKIFKPTFDGADQHATELNIKVNRRNKLKFNFNN